MQFGWRDPAVKRVCTTAAAGDAVWGAEGRVGVTQCFELLAAARNIATLRTFASVGLGWSRHLGARCLRVRSSLVEIASQPLGPDSLLLPSTEEDTMEELGDVQGLYVLDVYWDGRGSNGVRAA